MPAPHRDAFGPSPALLQGLREFYATRLLQRRAKVGCCFGGLAYPLLARTCVGVGLWRITGVCLPAGVASGEGAV
jgi:hypothetical protein